MEKSSNTLEVELKTIPAPDDVGIASLRTLEGAEVAHSSLGLGVVSNIFPGQDGDYRIVVDFSDRRRILRREDTDTGFVLTIKELGRLDVKLREELRNPGAMLRALILRVHSCSDPCNLGSESIMLSILRKIDRQQELEKAEIDSLKSAEDFGPLALYFERRPVADLKERMWSRVTACANWRRARMPDRNVTLSVRVLTGLPHSSE